MESFTLCRRCNARVRLALLPNAVIIEVDPEPHNLGSVCFGPDGFKAQSLRNGSKIVVPEGTPFYCVHALRCPGMTMSVQFERGRPAEEPGPGQEATLPLERNDDDPGF